ncbi:hypothetical protein AOLI_G00316810 [Acnodon oligacanthus]
MNPSPLPVSGPVSRESEVALNLAQGNSSRRAKFQSTSWEKTRKVKDGENKSRETDACTSHIGMEIVCV